MAEEKIKLKLSLEETCQMLRQYGIGMRLDILADQIAIGAYPFGRVIRTSPNGRRTFEIWRCDVEQFLKSKLPEGTIT